VVQIVAKQSRIGKLPITVPDKVQVTLDGNFVKVKGPKGELERTLPNLVTVEKDGSILKVVRVNETRQANQQHGLSRSLVNNMVVGVSEGFKREMEIIGVGYKAANQGNILELNLGYSHAIFMAIPGELKVTTAMEKGKNPMVVLEGIDKQLIGQVAAKIKSLRPVEPYKGKGVRFVGEQVRRKAGKTGGKK